jgi:hypothetical protein
LWIGAILAHIDFLDQLTDAIGEQLAPLGSAVELLCTITGVQTRAAEVILSEIGGDMTHFPTARHLASWAGQCPGNDQSAGKRRSGKTRNGSKWLDYTLEEVAIAAIRVKGTYLQAQYTRLRPRREHKKALGAVNTRSSAPSGTCSRPARPTATSAATTSRAATPNDKPDGYSLSSNDSATPSSSPQRTRPQPNFPVSPNRQSQLTALDRLTLPPLLRKQQPRRASQRPATVPSFRSAGDKPAWRRR